MSERDSQRIIRQWNREIEEELRRRDATERAGASWRAVAWAAVWAVWLLALVALFRPLG